ncbi:IS110 family transposase [Micromonospora sp. NPDC005173]|uniref:IS110 family transposase n=1 Tax=Micromonospora sp. NPDC005173 TaxID=3157165 RepID=UPI0033A18AFB
MNTVGPIRARLAGHGGYIAIQAIPGVGPVLGAVFVAEIGEVDRFGGPAQLTSWAGLTPRHRESDLVVHRGRITKQGSTLVKPLRGWAYGPAVDPGTAHTPARNPSPEPKKSTSAGQNPSLDRPRSFMDDTEGYQIRTCRVLVGNAG